MKVLVVEDDPEDVLILRHLLEEDERQRWSITPAEDLTSARKELTTGTFDVVVLDLGLPDSSELEGLDLLLSESVRTPIVILTGLDDQDMALEAVRRGAQDYLVKGDFSSTALRRTLLYAITRTRAEHKQAPGPSQVEDKIGRYKILKTLGSGGMGKVFLGVREGAGGFAKKVAIKQLLPSRSGDDTVVQRFLTEARLAAKLNHPNIVQIFELGESPEGYFIAMEYVPGCDLRRLLQLAREAGQLFPLHCTAHIVSSVCQALDYAHTLTDDQGSAIGLVHYDVSPANVMIAESGNVKLTDFGIARAISEEGPLERLSGRLSYMAPERLKQEPSDHRVDIYSAGILLYELCTGAHPFRRADTSSTWNAILKGTYIPPESRRRNLPPTIVDLIARALATLPEQRLVSARDIAEILQVLFPPDLHVVAKTAEIMVDLLQSGADVGLIADASTADID